MTSGPRDLIVAPTPDAPPPSSTLRDAMASMRPVRTRRPMRTLVLFVLCGVAVAVMWIALLHVRRDRADLPQAWWWTMALVWLAGFVGPLAMSRLPQKGAVLPDRTSAVRAASLAAFVLIGGGLLFTHDTPPATILVHGAGPIAARLAHCLAVGALVWAVPLIVLLWAQRKIVLSGRSAFGASLGAATGALAGLALHAICPFGGGLHVGLGQGGSILVAALVGAWAGPAILGRIKTSAG